MESVDGGVGVPADLDRGGDGSGDWRVSALQK